MGALGFYGAFVLNMEKQNLRIYVSPLKTVEIFSRPFPVFVFFLIFYLFAGALHASLLEPSKVAYFNYLADAFLHGQLYFRSIPPDTHDLILFNNLYFAGEVLNIDAVTGGFNFQAAWTTAWIASESIAG